VIIKSKSSPPPSPPQPKVTRVDLHQQVVPNLTETLQQPALAREVAVTVAGEVLKDRHDNIKKQLDILRRTRAARGGVGAPLDVPAHLRGDVVEVYDPKGYTKGLIGGSDVSSDE
jgi:hypothetical protein